MPKLVSIAPLFFSRQTKMVSALQLATSRLVAEGVKTARAARDLAEREGIDMPIVSEMYRVLYENESSRVAIDRLMTRTLKAE